VERRPWHALASAPNPYDELIDASEPRLVIITTPAYISDELVEEVCSRITALLELGERVSICYDMTNMSMVTGTQRRRIMQFQRDELHRFSKYFIAEAYVMRSFFARALIVAVESFARPSHPTRTFHDLEPAKAWLRHRINEEK
jgi:hypothetical protein